MFRSQEASSFRGLRPWPQPGALPLDPDGGSAPRPPLQVALPRSPCAPTVQFKICLRIMPERSPHTYLLIYLLLNTLKLLQRAMVGCRFDKRRSANPTAMWSTYLLASCLVCIAASVVGDSHCPELPYDCFHPNGSDCTWYERCLNVRAPCGLLSSEDERLCHLRSLNLSRFGYQTIYAGRKCVQTSLLSYLDDE